MQVMHLYKTHHVQVMLDNVGVELTPPSCSLCQEHGEKANSATNKIKSLEEMLNQREKQVITRHHDNA